MAAHPAHDVVGHRPGVQRGAAFGGDAVQHGCQRRVAQQRAHRVRAAVGTVEVGAGLRVAAQRLLVGQLLVQPGADCEAALGQADGRLQQLCPGQAAMGAVRGLQQPHGAGHADRAAAHHRLLERHGLAVGTDEQALVGRCGRRLAAIPGLHAPAVPVQQKGTTANAAALRLDQGQHHLHRHRRIHRAAAGPQHLQPGRGGQWVGGCHAEAAEGPAGLVGEQGHVAGQRWQVRRRGGGWRAGTARQQHQGRQLPGPRPPPRHAPALAARAWSMSQRMSSMCSSPTDSRTMSGGTPAASCCSSLS